MTAASPIEIIHLRAYAGPNSYSPQPGVVLRLRCERDHSQRLKTALKDGAQFIGLVLAYLVVSAEPQETPDGTAFLLTARFTTPTPDLGKALAAYVVDGLRAEALGDADWDRDTPLFALQQQRRREALPIALLQLLAEARTRAIPLLHLPDGRVQLGYGVRSWRCTPRDYLPADDDEDDEQTQPATLQPPPWADLGFIPIYAVTGERERASMVQQVAAHLQQQGIAPSALTVEPAADVARTVALLSDPATRCLVVGLHTASLVERGCAFERCTHALVSDAQGTPPPGASTTEWVRSLGVPVLLATGVCLLPPPEQEPLLAPLAAYAPHGLLPLHGPASLHALPPPFIQP